MRLLRSKFITHQKSPHKGGFYAKHLSEDNTPHKTLKETLSRNLATSLSQYQLQLANQDW